MFRIIDWIERPCERIYYGPEDNSDREVSQALDRAFRREPHDFVDSWLQDLKNKDRLNQELANAEWILEYEKRRISLQKKRHDNDHRSNKLEPTPTVSGNWNTTSQGFARTSPSTSVPALSS